MTRKKATAPAQTRPCAGQVGGSLKVAFTFALRCAIDRIHTGNDIGSGTRARRASPTLGHTGNHANADRGADRAGAAMSVASLVQSGPLLLAIPVAAAAGAVTFLSPVLPAAGPRLPGVHHRDVRRRRERGRRHGGRTADADLSAAEARPERRRGHHPRQDLGRRAGRAAPGPGGRGGGAVRPRLLGRVLADRPRGGRGRGAAAVARRTGSPRCSAG